MTQKLNSRGFTLTEIMVGLLLTTAAAITTMNFGFFFFKSQVEVIHRLETEDSLLRATYAIQRFISGAVNVQKYPGPGAIPDNSVIGNIVATPGYIYETPATVPITDQFRGITGAFTHHAAMIRDTSDVSLATKTGGNTQSIYRPALISYMAPTVNSSGVIFITNQATAGLLTPSYSKVFYDKVVEFGFTDAFTFPNGNISSVNLHIVMRHFQNNSIPSWDFFCPTPDVLAGTAGCAAPNRVYKDLGRDLRITLTNQIAANISGTGSGYADRTLGNIFIFPIGFNR